MKTIAVIFSTFLLFFIISCSSKKDKVYVPESFLGHVDIILDTATVRALTSDMFITSIFGRPHFDTITMMGRPSYDFYIIGQEHFLHISEARGFYENQAGGLSVIIQSKKPGMLDSLMATWKKFTAYAIEVNTSKGEGFALYEVFPVIGWTNILHPRLVPILTTYSPETYKTWGFGDSASSGITMKTFIKRWAGEEEIDNILFKKIDELYINATEKEKEVLASALLAGGYEEDGDEFTHKVSPKIYVETEDGENFTRISKIKFKLSRSAQPFEKTYGKVKVTINNDEGWFYFQ